MVNRDRFRCSPTVFLNILGVYVSGAPGQGSDDFPPPPPGSTYPGGKFQQGPQPYGQHGGGGGPFGGTDDKRSRQSEIYVFVDVLSDSVLTEIS